MKKITKEQKNKMAKLIDFFFENQRMLENPDKKKVNEEYRK